MARNPLDRRPKNPLDRRPRGPSLKGVKGPSYGPAKVPKGRKPGIYAGGNTALFIFAVVIVAMVVSCAAQL